MSEVFICEFCGREAKTSHSNNSHQAFCKDNPDKKKPSYGGLGRKGTNQYIKAEQLGLPKPKISDETRQKMIQGSSKKRVWSEESRSKLSKHAISKGLGGVRQSRQIKYKGKSLGSSYELTVVKSLDENNIEWDTCKRFNYIDPNGKKRTYTPDLYLPEYDVYLDPKNDFLIENINPRLGFKDIDKIRWVQEQNFIRVIILNKDQLNWGFIKTLL